MALLWICGRFPGSLWLPWATEMMHLFPTLVLQPRRWFLCKSCNLSLISKVPHLLCIALRKALASQQPILIASPGAVLPAWSWLGPALHMSLALKANTSWPGSFHRPQDTTVSPLGSCNKLILASPLPKTWP